MTVKKKRNIYKQNNQNNNKLNLTHCFIERRNDGLKVPDTGRNRGNFPNTQKGKNSIIQKTVGRHQ